MYNYWEFRVRENAEYYFQHATWKLSNSAMHCSQNNSTAGGNRIVDCLCAGPGWMKRESIVYNCAAAHATTSVPGTSFSVLSFLSMPKSLGLCKFSPEFSPSTAWIDSTQYHLLLSSRFNCVFRFEAFSLRTASLISVPRSSSSNSKSSDCEVRSGSPVGQTHARMLCSESSSVEVSPHAPDTFSPFASCSLSFVTFSRSWKSDATDSISPVCAFFVQSAPLQ